MKFLILLAVIALSSARPADHYDARYDSFNVDDLTANVRLLKSYAHCFLGEGKCTPDGNNFKKWIPEAVQTNCSKCTEKQKVMVAKVMKALMEKAPGEWEKLVKVHDPEKKRTADLHEYLAKYAA